MIAEDLDGGKSDARRRVARRRTEHFAATNNHHARFKDSGIHIKLWKDILGQTLSRHQRPRPRDKIELVVRYLLLGKSE